MKAISLLMFLGLFSLAVAEDVAEQAEALNEELNLELLVSQLGHADFKTRQTASDQLMREVEKDPNFAKKLKPFAKHEDPEVRFRIGELIADLPVILEWLDPGTEARMKSERGSFNPMKLTVKNRSKAPIICYWIDWQGIRQPRRTVKPGEECVYEKTFEGHVWLLADANGRGLGIYVPQGKKDAQIIFTGEEN